MCGVLGDTSSSTKIVRLTFNTAKEQIRKSLSPYTKAQNVGKQSNEARILSNDPLKAVQVFCEVCDKVTLLSGLRRHLKVHSMTMTDYIKNVTNPRSQIIQLVYHKCVICQEVVLLDADVLGKHLKKHQLSYSSYSRLHMKKGDGLLCQTTASCSTPAPIIPEAAPVIVLEPESTSSTTSSSTLSSTSPVTKLKMSFSTLKQLQSLKSMQSKASPIEVIQIDDDTPTVKIECKICFKTFKMNKQLSAHMKRH